MKRFVLLLISLIVILTSLSVSSCHKPSAFPEDTAKPAETEEEKNSYLDQLNSLPDKDFEGRLFRIATDTSELFIPKNQASVVGKELYLRNQAVEEKYNIKITLTDESGLPTIAERIRTEALSGTDYCDMVLLESGSFKSLISSDALMNVRSIPYLNLDSDYYHQNAIESSNFYNYTYGLSGSFNYSPENAFVIFYNKDLLSKTELPSLNQMVSDYQWDFENFLIYAEEVSFACTSAEKNVYGFTSTVDNQTLINAFWAAAGEKFIDNAYGEIPQLIYNTENTQTFLTQLEDILYKTFSYYEDTQLAVQTFLKEESFFLIAPLDTASEITGHGINWGVVPMPKQDINQKNYYSYLDSAQSYVGFAKGTSDTTFSGMITEALFCASKGVPEDLLIKSFLNLYLNAPEDAINVEKAINSPYYDASEFFSQDGSPYPAATQILLYRVLSSDGSFDSLYNQYLKMFQKYLDGKIK